MVVLYLVSGVLMVVLEDWMCECYLLYLVYFGSWYLNVKLWVFVDWVVEVFVLFDDCC